MMADLTVRIRTLTPLWTGGVDGTMDRIHETGILGSLRWWYEAIVRGLGGSACDPTSDDRCPDKDGNYCDVCAVFGATGLQRAFRLEGPVWWNEERNRRLTIRVNRNRGWYLGRGFLGQGEFHLRTLRLPEGWTHEDLQQTVLLTLLLISCWGGLGPKTQQGYGVMQVIQIANGLTLNVEQAVEVLNENPKQRQKRRTNVSASNLPSLDGFFFAKIRFPNQTTSLNPNDEIEWYLNRANSAQRNAVLPLAPMVRYHLRGFMHPQRPPKSSGCHENVRHRLMGELGKKSLIHVSHAYPAEDSNQWEFRIWGWIPEVLHSSVSRVNVFQHLRQWLGVTQERQWHPAKADDSTLWSRLNLSTVQVCWFTRKNGEETASYLGALLKGCDCEKEHTDTKGTG